MIISARRTLSLLFCEKSYKWNSPASIGSDENNLFYLGTIYTEWLALSFKMILVCIVLK